MSNSQIGPMVPVGSVIAYAGNVTALQQLEGWFPCDGRELNRLNHIELFEAIRYANGGDGSTTFKLPDYRGYFLRGVDQGAGNDPDAATRTAPPNVGNCCDAPGSLQQMATALPVSPSKPFIVTIPHLPQESKHVNEDKISGHRMMKWNGNTATTEFSGGAVETRPINNYVYFIIKHSHTTAAGTDVIIPIGSVVPIAGTNTAGLGNKWLLCSGNVLQRKEYKELFQVIQNIHGGDTENFYLPDYRGYFLRGVDGNSHHDQDAHNRLPPQPTLPPGEQGASGDNVGSIQYSDTAQATNRFTAQVAHVPPLDPIEVDDVSGFSNARWTSAITTVTAPTIGGGNTESRPINTYVDWYIKTFESIPQ